MGCTQCKGQRLKSDVFIPITVERVAFLFRIYRVPRWNLGQTACSDPGRLYLRTCSRQIPLYSIKVLHDLFLPSPYWCTADSSFCHAMPFSLELLKCWKMKWIFLKSLKILKINHKYLLQAWRTFLISLFAPEWLELNHCQWDDRWLVFKIFKFCLARNT